MLGLHLVEQKGAGLGQHRLVEAPVERVPRALAPGAGLLEVATLRRELDAGPDPRDRFGESRDPFRPLTKEGATTLQRRFAVLLAHAEQVGTVRELPVEQVPPRCAPR